jgi:acetoin utilization protein AcuB
MLVEDWMSRNVATVTEDVSMIKAGRIMREKKIRRLPVVDKEGRLTGIVSERDLKAASPSAATTLDVYEMTYLLSELKIKTIMTRDPVAIRLGDTVERAALIMRDRKFGSLPVVDAAGKVAGIITDTDIFRLFVSITGIDQDGIQIGLRLPTNEGGLKPVLDALPATRPASSAFSRPTTGSSPASGKCPSASRACPKPANANCAPPSKPTTRSSTGPGTDAPLRNRRDVPGLPPVPPDRTSRSFWGGLTPMSGKEKPPAVPQKRFAGVALLPETGRTRNFGSCARTGESMGALYRPVMGREINGGYPPLR